MNNIYFDPSLNKYLENKFLNLEQKSLLGLDIQDEETKRRSESAKEGWRKYRINYKLGNIRESIRNSMGLPPLDDKGFNYH